MVGEEEEDLKLLLWDHFCSWIAPVPIAPMSRLKSHKVDFDSS